MSIIYHFCSAQPENRENWKAVWKPNTFSRKDGKFHNFSEQFCEKLRFLLYFCVCFTCIKRFNCYILMFVVILKNVVKHTHSKMGKYHKNYIPLLFCFAGEIFREFQTKKTSKNCHNISRIHQINYNYSSGALTKVSK